MALQAPFRPPASRPGVAFLERHATASPTSVRCVAVSFTPSTATASSLSYAPLAMANSRFLSVSSSPKQKIRLPMIPRGSESGNVTTATAPLAGDRMLVIVPPHPLIKHLTSVLRNEQTPPAMFKSAMAELGRLLIYEACRDWLPMISGDIQSPMGVANVEFVDPREPVAIIPILRAGLALAEHAGTFLPATKTYHLGMSRDEETLQPSMYLNKMPERFPEGSRALVIDPMLATGGTIVAAVDLLQEKGLTPKQIKVISAVAAPPALEKLSRKFPGLHVYTAMIDPVVNEKGFIVPGLGDAGDRCYGTDNYINNFFPPQS